MHTQHGHAYTVVPREILLFIITEIEVDENISFAVSLVSKSVSTTRKDA